MAHYDDAPYGTTDPTLGRVIEEPCLKCHRGKYLTKLGFIVKECSVCATATPEQIAAWQAEEAEMKRALAWGVG